MNFLAHLPAKEAAAPPVVVDVAAMPPEVPTEEAAAPLVVIEEAAAPQRWLMMLQCPTLGNRSGEGKILFPSH